MSRPIRPRKILSHGMEKWLVHIPKVLQSPKGKKDRTFPSERAANEYAKQLTKERAKPIPNEFNKYPAFEQSEALRWLAEKHKSSAVTVNEIAEKCLQIKTESGKRKGSIVASRCAFRSLGLAIGSKPIQYVTSDDISAWLSSHTEWAMKTRINNYKQVSSLFNWCVKTNRLQRNPCVGVERPIVPFKPVQILTVANIRKLLAACREHDPALLGFFSLVLFGGLRVAEARRCATSELMNGRVDLGGDKCKLKNRRAFKMSPQLTTWLSAWQSDGKLYGAVGVPNFSSRIKAVIKQAGVVVPKNSLRHSMCSYNLQIHGAMTTARMANNSETMLNNHYAAMVTDEDAKAFSEILPEEISK